MIDFVWTLMSFIVAFSILVTVHEYGHFWVARRCGIKVEKFSIGFGRTLWTHTDRLGTEYVFALIPLGGYVKMLDERVADVPQEELHLAFSQKSVWARSAVVAAGPIANFLFAILGYWIIFLSGIPALKPVVTGVLPNTPAAEVVIDKPQKIISINQQKTETLYELNLAIAANVGASTTDVTMVDTDVPDRSKTVTLLTKDWSLPLEQQTPLHSLGFQSYTPDIFPVLSRVETNSPAQRAGLMIGDEIISINGKPFSTWQAFVNHVQASPNTKIIVEIERDGKRDVITIIPDVVHTDNRTLGKIGVAPTQAAVDPSMIIEMKYGFIDAFVRAVEKTWQLIVLSLKMLGSLIVGDISLEHLGGPISIAQSAGMSAESGWKTFVSFLVLFSVNLGIINLLPLPVLDGGHLMFYIMEIILGRPVSERTQEFSYKLGALVIFTLMSIALFNDFSRI